MAEFRWFGHNCIRFKAREATVLCDPVERSTGYVMPKQTADIITLSHTRRDEADLRGVKPPYQVLDGPGEYELHEVFISGLRTYRDPQKRKEAGHNTVYTILAEGLTVVHLGSLGHKLNEENTELLSTVDVLFVPAGGGDALTPEQAAEITTELEPKVVVPIRYQTPHGDKNLAPVDEFCKHLGIDIPEAQEKLTLKPSDFSETTQLVLLTPETAGSKR